MNFPLTKPPFGHDLDLLAVADEGLAEVTLVRAGVRDMGAIDRRERADHHDRDEHDEESQRDVVPTQPAPGEQPRALPLDCALVVRRQRGGRVEREIGRGLCRHAAFFPLER